MDISSALHFTETFKMVAAAPIIIPHIPSPYISHGAVSNGGHPIIMGLLLGEMAGMIVGSLSGLALHLIVSHIKDTKEKADGKIKQEDDFSKFMRFNDNALAAAKGLVVGLCLGPIIGGLTGYFLSCQQPDQKKSSHDDASSGQIQMMHQGEKDYLAKTTPYQSASWTLA